LECIYQLKRKCRYIDEIYIQFVFNNRFSIINVALLYPRPLIFVVSWRANTKIAPGSLIQVPISHHVKFTSSLNSTVLKKDAIEQHPHLQSQDMVRFHIVPKLRRDSRALRFSTYAHLLLLFKSLADYTIYTADGNPDVSGHLF
jgi:hypothetical protein